MSTHDPIFLGWLGSLAAGMATGLGALPVLFRAHWRNETLALMLAAAAGVMLGATFFSLLLPAMDLLAQPHGRTWAALVISIGTLLGASAIWGMHALIPHAHAFKGLEGPPRQVSRNWLLVFAIALHNVPEGLSVGVAYAGDLSTGLAVTIGIGLQNMPEGLAVATALLAEGYSRGRAVAIALSTGLVEPLAGLLGAWAASLSEAVLPWALSFAAGAMLWVVSGEVIPETHRKGMEQKATFCLVCGLVLMLWLELALG